jgi:hypothetical protein
VLLRERDVCTNTLRSMGEIGQRPRQPYALLHRRQDILESPVGLWISRCVSSKYMTTHGGAGVAYHDQNTSPRWPEQRTCRVGHVGAKLSKEPKLPPKVVGR